MTVFFKKSHAYVNKMKKTSQSGIFFLQLGGYYGIIIKKGDYHAENYL